MSSTAEVVIMLAEMGMSGVKLDDKSLKNLAQTLKDLRAKIDADDLGYAALRRQFEEAHKDAAMWRESAYTHAAAAKRERENFLDAHKDVQVLIKERDPLMADLTGMAYDSQKKSALIGRLQQTIQALHDKLDAERAGWAQNIDTGRFNIRLMRSGTFIISEVAGGVRREVGATNSAFNAAIRALVEGRI
jgi:hypothetical protein